MTAAPAMAESVKLEPSADYSVPCLANETIEVAMRPDVPMLEPICELTVGEPSRVKNEPSDAHKVSWPAEPTYFNTQQMAAPPVQQPEAIGANVAIRSLGECLQDKPLFRQTKRIKQDFTKKRKSHDSYSCLTCNIKFARECWLNKHMEKYAGQCVQSCNVCNKKFNDLGYLKKHMLIHTGNSPYKCEICNKAFTQISVLKRHQVRHTGDGAHQCYICKKCFKFKSELKRHIVLHTGQCDYECEICNKKFKQKSYLNTHMLVHTGEREYEQCSVCEKTFNDKSNFKRHVLTHMEYPMYKCDLCSMGFTLKSYFNKHMARHGIETVRTNRVLEIGKKRFK